MMKLSHSIAAAALALSAQINAPRPVTAIDQTNDAVPSMSEIDGAEAGDPNSVDYRNRAISRLD